MKSEAEIWREERDRVAARQTVAERVALWFARPTAFVGRVSPCPFIWHDTATLVPVEDSDGL